MKEAIKDNTVSAENQLKEDLSLFYVGNPDAKIKIAIVGNSITRHGILEEIGWTKLCGMAASDEDHDYVHVLYKKLTDAGLDVYMMVNQLAEWERKYKEKIVDKYTRIRDFGADYFLFRLGENVIGDEVDETFKEELEKLIDMAGAKKVIMATSFWRHKQVDPVILEVARERNYPVVELGELGDMDEMKAIGLYEHGGVAAHPGDKGMEAIADRFFKAILENKE